jgi:hypothetical protein
VANIPSGELLLKQWREGADVVIWLRKCNDELNEGKVLSMTLLEIPLQLPNWGAPTSLWRQTMARKSYW